MKLSNFLKSKLSAKEFLEEVDSSAITIVTDKPPETRIKWPDEEDKKVKKDLTKEKE
jgi:hypothetical protein